MYHTTYREKDVNAAVKSHTLIGCRDLLPIAGKPALFSGLSQLAHASFVRGIRDRQIEVGDKQFNLTYYHDIILNF